MIYLHQSEVSVHGKLRSCNCLIDGRFVLKISDFGLHTLTTPAEIIKDTDYFRSKYLHHFLFIFVLNLDVFLDLNINFFSELLWVAPELIPLSNESSVTPTQRGDVYSFGIILEEIILRAGPFQIAREIDKITIEGDHTNFKNYNLLSQKKLFMYKLFFRYYFESSFKRMSSVPSNCASLWLSRKANRAYADFLEWCSWGTTSFSTDTPAFTEFNEVCCLRQIKVYNFTIFELFPTRRAVISILPCPH